MNKIFKNGFMKLFIGLSAAIIGSLVGYQISMHIAGLFIGGTLGLLIFIAMTQDNNTESFDEGGFISGAMEKEKAAKNLKKSFMATPATFTAEEAAEGLKILSQVTTTVDSETSTTLQPRFIPDQAPKKDEYITLYKISNGVKVPVEIQQTNRATPIRKTLIEGKRTRIEQMEMELKRAIDI